MTATTCPECSSTDVTRHVHCDNLMGAILAHYYPHAHDCRACGHVWDEDRRQGEDTLRQLLLAARRSR